MLKIKINEHQAAIEAQGDLQAIIVDLAQVIQNLYQSLPTDTAANFRETLTMLCTDPDSPVWKKEKPERSDVK